MSASPYYTVGDEAERLRAEVDRLREALARIAEGRWNVGTTKLLSAREFAREALEAGER